MQWMDFTAPGAPLRQKLRFDPATKRTIIATQQPNINECLQENTDWRNADRSSSSLWGGAEYVKVASIPLWLLEKWQKEEGINFFRWNEEDKARLLKKMNDPDYQMLRTAGGTL